MVIQQEYVIIDGVRKIKAQIYTGRISMRYIKYNYSFDGKYLVVQEEDDNKLYYFLKVIDFRNKYIESRPEEILYNDKKVFKYNRLLNIDHLNYYNYDSLVSFKNNIKSYKKHMFTNKEFRVNFVLTKDNNIEDVTITKSVSPQFDKNFIKQSHTLSFLYKNNTGVDVLMEYVDYMGKYLPKRNEIQKEFLANKVIADYYYDIKQFNLSREIYAILYYNKDAMTVIDQALIKEIQYKLIISLLHTNNLVEACIMLNDIRYSDYFEVRNYLKEFCP